MTLVVEKGLFSYSKPFLSQFLWVIFCKRAQKGRLAFCLDLAIAQEIKDNIYNCFCCRLIYESSLNNMYNLKDLFNIQKLAIYRLVIFNFLANCLEKGRQTAPGFRLLLNFWLRRSYCWGLRWLLECAGMMRGRKCCG